MPDEVVSFAPHHEEIRCIAWCPDGRLIATAGWDSRVLLWDAATLRLVQVFQGHHSPSTWVQALAWSPDGRLLLSGDNDGLALVWEAATAVVVASHGVGDYIDSVGWAPDGDRILISTATAVHLADLASGCMRMLQSDGAPSPLFPSVAAWRRDGLAVGLHTGGQLFVWEPDTGQPIAATVDDFCWAFDARLALDPDRGQERLLAMTRGTLRADLKEHFGNSRALAVSPDGTLMAATGPGFAKGAAVTLWDLATGEPRRTTPQLPLDLPAPAWSPDGSRLLVGTGGPASHVLDIATGRRLLTVDAAADVYALAWSPDGRWIAAGGDGPSARVFDAATGQPLASLPDHHDFVSQVQFSPDSRALLTIDGADDARVWEASSGTPICTLHESWLATSLSWSPDSRFVVGQEPPAITRIWDATTGQPTVLSVDVFPGGELVVRDAVGTVTAASPGASQWLGRATVIDGRPASLPVDPAELPSL